MSYTPDNYDLYEMYEAAKAKAATRRPRCIDCGEPIMDDVGYRNPNGDGLMCNACFNEYITNDLLVDMADYDTEEW